MYRFFLTCALLLAFGAFGATALEAQESARCYVCDEAAELCNEEGPVGETEGCGGDGGITICRAGVCSDDCENHEGHCKIVYNMLDPFGVTPAQEVIFSDELRGRVAVLPLPGYQEDALWGRWACAGELLEVYRQVGEDFELVPLFDVGSYELTELQ